MQYLLAVTILHRKLTLISFDTLCFLDLHTILFSSLGKVSLALQAAAS